jgi:hypothetical protein
MQNWMASSVPFPRIGEVFSNKIFYRVPSPVCDDVVKLGTGMEEKVVAPLLERNVQRIVLWIYSGTNTKRMKLNELIKGNECNKQM